MRAVITVIGKDTVGIIAEVTKILSENNVNILDITQSVLSDLFAMIMLTDITDSKIEFPVLSEKLQESGTKKGVKVHVMHEDIFNAMHRI